MRDYANDPHDHHQPDDAGDGGRFARETFPSRPGATPSTRRQGPSGWWAALTVPADPPASAAFAERERARRGRLASVLLLALFAILLGALWQYLIVDDDHPAMKLVLAVALGMALLAGLLNRTGNVTGAGLLLVVLADLPLAAIPATALGGHLDVLALESFYLLAGSVLVAASLLAPWSVFLVALVNTGLMFATIAALPHTRALDQLLASNNAQQALIGPILMQVIVAVVAFLWARSTLAALRRADRAEEIAALERREIERTAELEEGVQQLLATHVQLANGNFGVRAPVVRNHMLWQIGNSLNILIGRLARLAQADDVLRRTQDESRHLASAIRAQRGGQAAHWPALSGTPLDDVIAALGGLPAATPAAPFVPYASPTSAPPQRATGLLVSSEARASDVPAWLFPARRDGTLPTS